MGAKSQQMVAPKVETSSRVVPARAKTYPNFDLFWNEVEAIRTSVGSSANTFASSLILEQRKEEKESRNDVYAEKVKWYNGDGRLRQ